MQENANWAVSESGLCKVCGNESWSVGQQPAEKDVFERKKRFWVSDNAPLSRNIVAVPRQGLVCSILQCLQSVAGHQPPLLQTSPLQHCTQTLHGVMPGWSHGHVSQSPRFQTDVTCNAACVNIMHRHSHDFMQTEHYTGINYCYKNNQVRRIVYIIEIPHHHHIIHQMYILLNQLQVNILCICSRSSPHELRPWCLTIECLSPISLWSRVRQTAPAKSAKPRPAWAEPQQKSGELQIRVSECLALSGPVWPPQQGEIFCTWWGK